jgi:putative ABC transport system permease protein
MTAVDTLRYAWRALRAARLRTSLMLLAMAIGVASVVLLTALGDGARRYVTGEFASLGTHLLIVLPGRSETTGSTPPVTGETPRDLTLDDARALTRSRAVRLIAPLNVGSAPIGYGGREREAMVLGTSAAFQDVRHLEMSQGRFLPAEDLDRATPVCVIGAKLRNELFGAEPALGSWVRVGDRRFRVVGILGSRGESIGMNMDEVVIIPVAAAQRLFNTPSLFRILVEARSRESVASARTDVLRILRERHEGEEDVTVVTQDAVLATFDRILGALTLTVAGIAGISLAVAGVLIMNVMLVAVTQRAAEIGLIKALGATPRMILAVFLGEAALLSMTGAVLGLLLGLAGSYALSWAYPQLPAGAPWWAVMAALGVAVSTGLLFGVQPARRAALLDPVQCLSRK